MARKSGTKTGWLGALLPSEETRRGLARGAAGTALAVAVVAAVLGALRVRETVWSQERFWLDRWRVDVGPLPAWVTPEIRRAIRTPTLPPGERLCLFRKGVLGDLRRALEASPWVAEVEHIRLSYPTTEEPGSIRASLRLRVPVAIVRVGRLWYLTDAAGRRLGAPYDSSPADWFGVPVVTGVRTPAPVPEPGDVWRPRDVREGVAVARVLYTEGILHEFPQWPIEAIDVANVGGRRQPDASEIVLHCAGRRLEWGRSPASPRSRTISTDALLENLRYVLRHMHETRFELVKLWFPRAVAEKG